MPVRVAKNIIHLNIALSMMVSLYFGGNSHVSNGFNMYLLRSPVEDGDEPSAVWFVHCIQGQSGELGT